MNDSAVDAKRLALLRYQRERTRVKPRLRCAEQFDVLSEFAVENWRELSEDEYTQWLDDEYLTDRWYLSLCTTRGTVGVVLRQNSIESHHRTTKTTAVVTYTLQLGLS
ncbi:hypothetical protein JG687_00009671 [Phytophthora cactorum]|uniref:Uncharacterized protein n=1 Tax=Phytophthora cactorum TaxID=29920 RepID=A0A8T1UC19_9STRA|nr:hypothetical protein JG687_00009671 [Phytophthora cactorum]